MPIVEISLRVSHSLFLSHNLFYFLSIELFCRRRWWWHSEQPQPSTVQRAFCVGNIIISILKVIAWIALCSVDNNKLSLRWSFQKYQLNFTICQFVISSAKWILWGGQKVIHWYRICVCVFRWMSVSGKKSMEDNVWCGWDTGHVRWLWHRHRHRCFTWKFDVSLKMLFGFCVALHLFFFAIRNREKTRYFDVQILNVCTCSFTHSFVACFGASTLFLTHSHALRFFFISFSSRLVPYYIYVVRMWWLYSCVYHKHIYRVY